MIQEPPDSKRSENILLIDDLDSPRFICRKLISSLNLGEVHCAEDAITAFNMLKCKKVDFYCIITDVNMPDFTGIDLLRWIRKDSDLCNLPVIILTSNPMSDYLFQALKIGASGFLVKPPNREQLRSELMKARQTFYKHLSPRFCKIEDVEIVRRVIEKNNKIQ